jgi:Leucine-rich repeat (LRR) protein
MRFTQLLTNLILEQSRFQVLYDKMVKPAKGSDAEGKKAKGLMPFEVLKNIIFADPTTVGPRFTDNESRTEFILTATEEEMEKVKVGKYTQWLLKNFVAPTFDDTDERANIEKGTAEYKRMMKDYQSLFFEDLYKITEDLKKYERFKNQLPQDKRDINKISSSELYDLVKDFRLEKTKASKDEKEKAKTSYQYPGSEIVFRGPKWTLIKIEDKGELGKGAAVFFGGYQDGDNGESRWCTSAPGLSYFNGYIKDGPLFVVLPNDDKGQVGKRTGLPVERFQFHFPSNQYMDRHDRQINLVEYLNGPMEELKDFFKPEFAKGLVSKGGNKVEVNYPDSSAGKFIALYGFDELFDSLPDTIEHLIVTNKSKENIALDVPESLTRFKNLDALLFSNIVRTLPENLGDLKNLKFLNLANNKDLVSLPESIKDIPNLALLNLKNANPNVVIPPALKEVLSDEGEGFFYLT